jgi:hypothetical protein
MKQLGLLEQVRKWTLKKFGIKTSRFTNGITMFIAIVHNYIE